MKVSVIMPVYNTEKYLRRALDSLLNQTLEGVEIIAVDDGSTDSCGAILDELQNAYPDRIQVFHKKNGGQATARNLALPHCKGEYIGFLDSDDYVDSDMFQVLYAAAKKQDADYVACGYRDTTWVSGEQIILKDYVASKPVQEPRDLFFGALVSPFLHLYKREILLENGIVFPEGMIYEDTAFYLNAIPYIQHPITVERALATRVRRKQSTMTLLEKNKVAQIMPVLAEAIRFYDRRGYREIYGRELEYFCVRVLLCSSMERIAGVSPWKDGWELVKQTLCFLQKYFPHYRKNPYFRRGLLQVYLRSFCRLTACAYYPALRIRAKMKRRYE